MLQNRSGLCSTTCEQFVQEAGGDLDDIVKLTVLLTDLADFPTVNEIMVEYFSEPYPARAAYGVASLPKGVPVEIEAVMQTTG